MDLRLNMDEYLPLREVVFKTLRNAIVHGEFEPGERLMEVTLAKRLGVSRTPVREAMRMLELEGLVVMIPRRGAEVARITTKDLSDALEIRMALEDLAAGLACKRIDDEGKERLKQSYADFKKAVSSKIIPEIVDADVAFHNTIMDMTNNPRLISMSQSLREQVYRYRVEYVKDFSYHDKLIAEHEALMNAIIARDEEKAKRHEFLPTDYVTSRRIKEMETGIIKLMLDNESNIDGGRVVPVKDEMEKIYRELFSGVGAYGPEKMFTVAFADKKLTEQDLNVMYGSPINDRRTSIMEEAARAFVDDISEEQPLCVLADGYKEKLLAKKYISVPNVMPYFSKAVKAILMAPPYNEKEDSITLNPGEIEISIDDIFVGVPVSMMQCAMEMQMAYNAVYDYKGLHIDEVNKDMKSFPDFVTI